MDSITSQDDGRPTFDDAIASELLGKYVLVGITRLDQAGDLIEKIQYHGEVVVADSHQGFCVKLRGHLAGKFEWLPPDTRNFFKARPGEYNLYSPGEIVVDPDYTSTWTSTANT